MYRIQNYCYNCLRCLTAIAVVLLMALAGGKSNVQAQQSRHIERSVQIPLSLQDSNVIKTSWPSIGCWFWQKEEFTGDGYKRFIDLYEQCSSFKLLTTSLRYPGDLTDRKVYKQIKAASLYAREKGMAIVMDLDIRLARDSFRAKYPGELQQIVFIKEFPLNKKIRLPLELRDMVSEIITLTDERLMMW